MQCCTTCTNVVFPDPAMPRQMIQAFFLVLVVSFSAPPTSRLSTAAVCCRSAGEGMELEAVSIPSAILHLEWKWDPV